MTTNRAATLLTATTKLPETALRSVQPIQILVALGMTAVEQALGALQGSDRSKRPAEMPLCLSGQQTAHKSKGTGAKRSF
jgi:hypothetical protein